jgi:glycosyltransferase involved in cell wall biosynthesis
MQSRLGILINASTLPNLPTGIGMYGLELARALALRPDTTVVLASPNHCPEGIEQMHPPRKHRQMWTQFRLPRLMAKEGLDVYLGTEFTVPVFTRIPRVAMVHDFAAITMPKLFTPGGRFHWHLTLQTARHANRVIVPSAVVAADAKRLFNYPIERVRVVPLAGRPSIVEASPDAVAGLKRRMGIERPYVLCVGIQNRHKRAVDVIRAVAILKDRGVEVDLVLGGEPFPFVGPHYHKEVARLGIGDRVHFTGYIEDNDLPALYTGALALAFPSVMEGFGIPPIEAMACGTPVIATAIPTLVETLGGAAMRVSPRSPGEIAGRVAELLASDSCRAEWSGRGRERAAMYSWERTAAETMEVFREIV